MFLSFEGDGTARQTNCDGKTLRGDCTVVMKVTLIGILEIWRPLIWIEEQVHVVLTCRWGLRTSEC